MLRKILMVLLVVVAGVLLLFGAAFAYAQTGIAKQQIGGAVERALSEPGRTAEVQGIQGLIPFNVRIGRFSLSDDRGTWLEVDRAKVDLSPADLLAGKINIGAVGAERIRIERMPPPGPEAPPEPPSNEPFTLPSLPESLPAVTVDRIFVDSLELGQELAGQEARFAVEGRATTGADGRRVDAALDLKRLDQDTASASLAAVADLAARNLSIDLGASETGGLLAGITGRPEAGSLSVDLDGAGPFSDFRAKLRADAQNLASLSADLGLAVEGAPRIDLTGALEVADGVLPAQVGPLVGDKLDLRIKAGQRSADLYAAEEIDIRGGGFSLTGQGEARLDARTVDGRLALDVPSLAVVSDLAGMSTGGNLRLDATASGDLYQPALKVDLAGQEITADNYGIGNLRTAVNVGFLGPLDEGYAGISVDAEGGADGVTMNGAPMPGAGAPRWSLVARVPATGEAQLERLELNADALTVAANGTVDQQTLVGQGHLNVAAPDLAALLASLGTLAPPSLPLSGGLSLDADAAIAPEAEQITIDLTAGGNDLAGLPPGAQELVGPAPKLVAKAIVEPGRQARVEGLSLTGAELNLGGNVTAGLAGRTLAGEVTVGLPRLAALSGVAGQPIEGDAQATARLGGTFDRPAVDLNVLANAVKAAGLDLQRIALDAKAEGAPDDLAGDMRLAVAQPQGEVTLATAYKLLGQKLGLTGLSLDGPATRLAGDVEVDLASLLASGRLQGGVTDLAALRPWHGQNLNGSVKLDADLSTPGGRQDARVRVDANGVAGDFGTVDSLAVDATANDALGTLGIDGQVVLNGFSRPGTLVETATLTAKGDLADLQLTAQAKGQQQGPFDLASRARLQVAGPAKQVDLQNLAGTFAGQTIELRAPARLKLDQGVLDLDQLDLRIGQARIQGDASTGNGRLRANATVSEFPLAMLADFGGPALDGVASAQLAMDGPLAAPEATLRLTVPDLRPSGAAARDIPAADLTVGARLGDGRLTSDLTLAKLTDKPITAELAAPVTFGLQPFAFALPPDGAISGRLDADADLERLAALAALDGQRVAGRMNAAMRFSGTIAQPQVNGRVDVGPARIEDSITGVLYRNVRLVLDANGRTITVSQLNADGRNNGKITGNGEVTLGTDGNIPYRLETKLSNAELLRNDLGTVIVSGNVDLEGDSDDATLASRLEVQRADFNIPDNTGPSIPVLDVEVAGQEVEPAAGPEARKPFDMMLDIAVNAPARLFVRGRGLDSEWGGSLAVKGPAAEAQVVGNLEFRRGFLDFLDRRFKVRSGTIAFSGASPPVPEINIEAESQGENILAIVKITGPANDPTLELTSEPVRPRDEVLAQLLFKRDMSQITPAQGVRLANAVATLEGRGIDVIGKFRSGLGLDTLDVGGESADDANVRAGKYLADNVYLEMQQGLQSGSGKARLEVELTPNVSVSTEVSEQSQTGVGLDWKMDY